MRKLLALACVTALLAACAQAPQTTAKVEQIDEGAMIAASLGYHIPATRAAAKNGN